jgi:predicted dehydrogenase/threonine dehydrogenase-like Zn-dependent dehydrogenase
MRQVTQRPRDGKVAVRDVPPPALRPGWVVVSNRCSLISAGTERGKIQMGEKNLLEKARARPDLARKVVERARAEGIAAAVHVARDRLDALAPLGYSSAGVVERVGPGVEGLAPGQRVACAGAGWANHAEIVAVPRNLIARIPDGVGFDAAAYATVGAVALHGVRQAEARLGERIGVVGLGLVGQLAVRLLMVAGCEPVGIDPDPDAVELAGRSGVAAFRRDAPALEAGIIELTDGLGLDAVLVCAASSSPDPLELAARLARERGRLVMVGDVPVNVPRALLYDKELELRLSRSYGPGRYDRDYEQRGRDLPPGYVRWTEQRNLQAFLNLIGQGRLNPSDLTTHRFPIDKADRAYELLSAEQPAARPFGVLLDYPTGESVAGAGNAVKRERAAAWRARQGDCARVGVIGAGAFARATLLPALRRAGADLVAVSTESGLSAADAADRFGFRRTADDAREILEDASLDAVLVATRHSSHAPLVAAALRAGKSVFVEKPLALDRQGLEEVEAALAGADGVLMVGFNRRFAPLTGRLREALGRVGGQVITVRVNAGPLPADHWLHDLEDGGGRLVGEGCHFVDLIAHLAPGRIVAVNAYAVPDLTRPLEATDSAVAVLRFDSGSVGSLVYTGAGDPRLPKERIEAHAAGVSAVIDDFRRLEIYAGGRRTEIKSAQDKGHRREVEHWVAAVAGRASAPPPGPYLASTRATLALAESLRSGASVELAPGAAADWGATLGSGRDHD